MIKGNMLFRRYDYKEGRILPVGAIPCQPNKDPFTGHWPHWIYGKKGQMCKIKRTDFGFNWKN